MELRDYSDAKNETAAKNACRNDLKALLFDFLVETFGAENVSYVENNTIGFVCGTVTDKDGYLVNMVAHIKPVIKNYQAHNAGKANCPSDAYDFDQDIQDFKDSQKNKKGSDKTETDS